MSLVASMLSANGRMAPADFQKAGFILIAISFVLSLTSLFLPVYLASGIQILLGLALIYPWVCIWSSRLHDAGKSGWMFLIVMVAWIILELVMGQIVSKLFGGETSRMMQAAMETGNPDAILQASEAAAQATALPDAILYVIVGVAVIFAGNAILKQDPVENRYGPVPGHEGEPEAMPAEAPVVEAAPAPAPEDTPVDPDEK